LLGELTVVENITLPLRLADVAEPADVDDLMERLGIDRLAGRLPNEISLGEQQRTALARAAVVGPRVLLADEPISHQNHGWALAMMALLADLAGAGTACLLATHNEVAFAAARRVLELRDGRIS
jgi:putative ABC transport system ATP-binding protein